MTYADQSSTPLRMQSALAAWPVRCRYRAYVFRNRRARLPARAFAVACLPANRTDRDQDD